jgi:hypothetical protein
MHGRMSKLRGASPAAPGSVALLALVLCAVAGRLLFVAAFGGGLPFWDQWDAEGALLLKPWMERTLTPSALFAPHNEHRVLWTRLVVLGLFEANGRQWDNLPAALLNAGLAGVVWGLLWAGLARGVGGRARALLAVAAVVLCWLPFGWENSLLGFNTHFFLLMLGAVGLAWLAGGLPDRPLVGAGVLGLLALASSFTMASSVLTCVAAAGMVVLRVRLGTVRPRTALAWTCVLGAVAALTWAFVPVLPGHVALKAAGAGEWWGAARRALAWPAVEMGGLGLALWLPAGWAAVRLWRTRRAGEGELMALGLSAWVVGQAAAMAYARGHGFTEVSSRYTDLLAVGVLAGLRLALGLGESGAAGTAGRWLPAGGVLLVAGAGLWATTSAALASARAYHQAGLRHGAAVRGFVRDGDARALAAGELPYPDADRLRRLLDTPSLRSVLPPEGKGGEPGPLGRPARRLSRAVRKLFGLSAPWEGEKRFPPGTSCPKAHAVPVPAGGTLGGTLENPAGEWVAGLELLLGTYGGRADGALRVTVCGETCASGEARLSEARDNEPLALGLAASLRVPPDGRIRYTVEQPGAAVHPVALWSCPGASPAEAAVPRLWLWVTDTPRAP